jgi:hypothetical protein
VVLSLTGFLMSCGGGGSSSTARAARVYNVTVLPTATAGGVTNPAPLVITVTVQ